MSAFLGSESTSNVQNVSNDSHNVTTNTQNVDQSQVSTNSQEISVNHTNSDNSSWSQVTDASVKALDSFNRNINYQLSGVGNIIANPNDASGLFNGLDVSSFFKQGSATLGGNASSSVDTSGFFSSPALSATTTSLSKYMKWIYIAAAVAAVWFFFLRKKKA